MFAHSIARLHSVVITIIIINLFYGDSVDNTAEENSSVFSLIRMCWLPPARACRMWAVKLCTDKILQFLTVGAGRGAESEGPNIMT